MSEEKKSGAPNDTRPADPYVEIRARLVALADAFIAAVTADGAITAGVVTGSKKPPYRRLECDGRELAFIRLHPKMNHIRIEIRGLWYADRASRRRVSTPRGMVALAARDETEVLEVAEYVKEMVARTRAGLPLGRRCR